MKTVKGFRLNKYSYKTSTEKEKTHKQTRTHKHIHALTNITKTYTTLPTYTHRNTPT